MYEQQVLHIRCHSSSNSIKQARENWSLNNMPSYHSGNKQIMKNQTIFNMLLLAHSCYIILILHNSNYQTPQINCSITYTISIKKLKKIFQKTYLFSFFSYFLRLRLSSSSSVRNIRRRFVSSWHDHWPVSYTHLTLPTKRIV